MPTDPKTIVAKLETFLSPEDFMQIQSESDKVSQGSYLSQGQWCPVREAWVAGSFAQRIGKMCGPIEVRMVAERFPDFELRLNGQVLPFEITMVTTPGRRMGDEAIAREEAIANATKKGESARFPVGSYADGEQLGPTWVAEGVARKADKRYDPRPHLLVNANFNASDLDPQELRRRCQPYTSHFHSVWVLHAGRCLLLSPSDSLGCQTGRWYR